MMDPVTNETVCKDCTDPNCNQCSREGSCDMCIGGSTGTPPVQHFWTQNDRSCQKTCAPACVDGQNGCFKCENSAGSPNFNPSSNECAVCMKEFTFDGFQRACVRQAQKDICPGSLGGDLFYFYDTVAVDCKGNSPCVARC